MSESAVADCGLCDGVGEHYQGASFPGDEGFVPCNCCGGTGKRPTDEEIAELRLKFLETVGDLQGSECEARQYREENGRLVKDVERLRHLVRSAVRTIAAYEERDDREEPGPFVGAAWAKVSHLCGIGSTRAYALCREFEVDPELGAR